MTVGARAAPVDLQVLSKRENSAELQEPHRKHPCVGDDGTKFTVGDLAGARERAGARPEEHLILDDVPNAGENRLVQQDVGNFFARKRPGFPERRLRIPGIRHDVRREVVVPARSGVFDEFQ